MSHDEALGFEEYVRARHDALLRSARRLVPDPVDAQDLLQTALARTYGRWDGIADKNLADAYLRRVMINTRTEWWRARKLEEVPTEQLPDASVDDATEQHADRALLMDVLKVLAPKQRSVVVLRHWEQMSTEETAAALGMSTGTVKSTLHRALARLRHELESRSIDSYAAHSALVAKAKERSRDEERSQNRAQPRVPAQARPRVPAQAQPRVPAQARPRVPAQGAPERAGRPMGTVRALPVSRAVRGERTNGRRYGREQERCAA
ncbi:SigE family RNA polymerase sigma factor [Streptomyces sp. MUM 203J]|uniref:SigE family RNA polymerase sigma factor n=1 Tax=Streptomyces sp. MUM 203J TaxID=2791990 RepID=UPI0035ABA567|nr:SigE family RNA polymerase sigma factor [Streptomyces sp. MUM 203J]